MYNSTTTTISGPRQLLNYKDIYLVPRKSILTSREQADISMEFLGRKFAAPFLPANMASVINRPIAKWLSENNLFYIYHRFESTWDFVLEANRDKWKTISISVGVKQEDRTLINNLINAKLEVDFITIDIASGHSVLMQEMLKWLHDAYGNAANRPKFIAGNVATYEAVKDLMAWGADCVKAGVGGGKICSTKNMTGFHIPMFSCALDCCQDDSIPIILDGGVRENGDIAKALVAGNAMIMSGSLFSPCIDAPGENVYDTEPVKNYSTSGELVSVEYNKNITHKKYHGSSSLKQTGVKRHIEGFETLVECNQMTVAEKYQELSESLKSAVSYAGGENLSAFNHVQWGYIN